MSDHRRRLLLLLLKSAKEHVSTLYGECSADPIIIAGHDTRVMSTYGSRLSRSRVGMFKITPTAMYIVLGAGGFNTDVLAHELAHAELGTRIGYLNTKRIPDWFDEGLAVQLDERYAGVEWQFLVANHGKAPDLEQMSTIAADDWGDTRPPSTR